MENDIKLNEMFCSLQGEGGLSGVCSVFLRLGGCPLRCKWCDTKYAWSENSDVPYSLDQIKEFIMAQPSGHIVVTGGEPMVHEKLKSLIDFLAGSGLHITIETSGIEYIGGLKCDLMSISPKLSNSIPNDEDDKKGYLDTCLKVDTIKKLMQDYDYQLKFVVDDQGDLDEIAELVEKLEPDADKVMLMPQAITPVEYLQKAKWVADACVKSGFRFSPRLQVLLWDGKKGK